MRPRSTIRAYVGLGANLGDAGASMADAIAALDGLPGVAVKRVSRLYATRPWGMTEQPEFRNAAVALDVRGDRRDAETGALALLGSLKTLERQAGRRPRERWGPREIDLDLLVYGRHRVDVERSPGARSTDATIDTAKAAKRLQVPHRDLGERLFVLAPLADLAPRLVPPGWHETVETRRRHVAATEPPGSVRVVGAWDPSRRRWRAAS
ncbi:MAG TPA: 2-amino-4-hydroxy-6-hydroxymethyldihydropteridine diphosphokinase [Candidatus Limnocylindrales bacterium]|nr:2-amino-4-hydroxy-6-hydroxymethyldihydropteridine diphosphokinase [Candidatus Limnocylindrales bacterium]